MFRRVSLIVGLLAVVCAAAGMAQTLQPMTAGVVPVVAHLPGAEGSTWRTSLYVTQVEGSSPALVHLTLLNPSGGDWSMDLTLGGAGASAELSDVTSAFGEDIPDGKYILLWDSSQKVVLSTRTFTVESAGSYGQGIGSVAQGTGFGSGGSVTFPAPIDSGSHRVNVGVANSGDQSQTFTITALDGSGNELGSWEKTVAPGAIEQFRANENGSGAGSVVVTCTDGCDGTAFGYMSVVVNDSNDAYFQYASAAAGEEETAPVSTVRDDKGVWYITGGTIGDVFEAMGYAVATDRLWQMELYRRSARGTMAEVFGPGYLDQDVLMRTTMYTDAELDQLYRKLDAESKSIIRAYVQGVNRRIAEIRADPSQLPFEFAAVGAQGGFTFIPADWTVNDCLAWVALMQRNFDVEALDMGQVDNAALYQALTTVFGAEQGAGMFADLRWINDPAAQTYIPGDSQGQHAPAAVHWDAGRFRGLRTAATTLRNRLQDRIAKLEAIGARVKMGSYAWVVSGSKTASGHPIIYSGPQMGFPVPSIVLEGSIRGGGLEVSGMTVAGVPGIIIGRTPHHAWSMQVGHAHTTDYYFEPPQAVQLDRMETIHVMGGDDVTIPVFKTSHGPVVYPIPFDPQNPGDTIVSWKYAHWGYEAGTIRAFLNLAKATSVGEFGAAIENIAVSQHFCYADKDGNIAFWMSGRDPVRPAGADPRLPLMGDGTQEWPQPVTLKPRAHDENTARGYYGGWNNKAAVWYDNPPNNIWYQMGPAHRAHVIYDYLDNHNDLSYEQVRDLALYIATTDSFGRGGNTWSFVSDVFAQAVQAHPSAERNDALALLQGWDGHFVDGGESQWVDGLFRADAWVLQDAWIREVMRLTFEDEFSAMGMQWDSGPLGTLFNVLLHALGGESSSIVNNYDWFQDVSASGKPTDPQEIIVLALDNVLAQLGPRPWQEARGKIRYVHPLLGEIGTTPFASRSTYAHCVEFGPEGAVRIESMFPLGESGDIRMDEHGLPVYDPNFFSMKNLFDTFTHRVFPLFD